MTGSFHVPTRAKIIEEARSWIGTPFNLKLYGIGCTVGRGFPATESL